eukprot:9828668-Alexandrium_andersonii.AAC.1
MDKQATASTCLMFKSPWGKPTGMMIATKNNDHHHVPGVQEPLGHADRYNVDDRHHVPEVRKPEGHADHYL